MVNKFFLMTRGRTGSTAVIDELNKTRAVCATQELFLIYDFDHIPNHSEIPKVYDLLPPFVLWKREDWSRKWIPNFLYSNKQWAGRYLSLAESLAGQQGATSFGFKVLSHNLEELPFLSTLLKLREYRSIYLTRNVARQVLSGMVANQRGLWNTRDKINDTRQYHIDLDKFQWHIMWEKKAVEHDLSRLTTEGIDYRVVSYEEFCRDRELFYKKIFNFLGLSCELPPQSNWSVMINDLQYTLANYDAVVERAAALGTPLDS